MAEFKPPKPSELGKKDEPVYKDTQVMAWADLAYYNHVHDSKTLACVKNRFGPKCLKPKRK